MVSLLGVGAPAGRGECGPGRGRMMAPSGRMRAPIGATERGGTRARDVRDGSDRADEVAAQTRCRGSYEPAADTIAVRVVSGDESRSLLARDERGEAWPSDVSRGLGTSGSRDDPLPVPRERGRASCRRTGSLAW
ncbi:hypothetical protein GCM10022202_04120 [Microbacterium marinilacus]|uniref:Uncharacterized protein n=1 Tax=Microbacterium marinilacus TaxID=415209 RepID=A0ABP7B4Q6_9MICO